MTTSARRVEGARDRQRESSRTRTDVEPRLARPDEREQRIQDRIVGPGRVGPEERTDRGVEVGAVRDLAEPLDLLAVGAHARGPGGLDRPAEVGRRVDVGVGRLDRDLADELGMCLEHRPQPAIAGRLRDQAEGGAADEDRVPAPILRVDRHDDRPAALHRCVDERADDRGGDERLVAEGDEDRPGVRPDRLEPDLQRARQAAFRVGIDDPARATPVDGGFDPLGIVPEHDHRLPHPGLGQGVQDVLEDRPATDRRQQLAATEARSGPGGKDESHGPIGHIGIFPPPCGQSSLAAPRPTTPVAGRRCEGVRDR